MCAFKILVPLLLLTFYTRASTNYDSADPVLYYYGIEESERGLPECLARQACSALVARRWRAPALVRLCRCSRRRRCDTRAHADAIVELNNRAHLQFCQSVNSWAECSAGETPLTVETTGDRMNPDELEELHRKNIQLAPPKIVLNCRCREPNYWKLNTTVESENTQYYQCFSLLLCKTGDYCGNVNYDFSALHQSCLCPRRHMCVHSGGVAQYNISELMYRGKGWRAYCQRIGDEDSYEDYV